MNPELRDLLLMIARARGAQEAANMVISMPGGARAYLIPVGLWSRVLECADAVLAAVVKNQKEVKA